MENSIKFSGALLILLLSSIFVLGQDNVVKFQKIKLAQQKIVYDNAKGVVPIMGIPLSSKTEKYSTNDDTKDILWDNGPLITLAGGGSGGSDYSEVQDASLGMATFGLGIQIQNGQTIADDFEVTDTWTVNTFIFYGYQTDDGPPSTLNDVRFQVYDGDPSAGGTVIFGDLTTNKMISTDWTNTWRVLESNPEEDLPVMEIVADAFGLVLAPGTYWIEWQVGGTGSDGPWCPPITISGETSTGNALHYTASGWEPAIDAGTFGNQGFPFIIEGTLGALSDNNIGVGQIISPASGVDLSSDELVTIEIVNIGNNPQSNFDVSFSIDGGAFITETVSTTINSLESYEYTFSTSADLSEYGIYALEACTNLGDDENPYHDCTIKTIENSEESLCIAGLYVTGCSLGDGLISWALAEINVPEITCDGNPYEWYHDYTNMVHTLEAGTAYTLTAQAAYENTYLDVWIDYNDDLFLDDNEHIVDDFILVNDANSYEIPITIPANVLNGQHILRYRTSWNGFIVGSCDTYNYGNMCDFTAEICGGTSISPPTNLTSDLVDGNVVLSWEAPNASKANQGKDFIAYKIYQNLEGGPFLSLGSTSETTYTHEGPDFGLNCYFVTALYDEGESVPTDETCELITGIHDMLGQTISLFPNPANKRVNIHSDFEIISVMVYNYEGQIVMNANDRGESCHIQTSQLNAGIYLFQINTIKGIIYKRIIIQ